MERSTDQPPTRNKNVQLPEAGQQLEFRSDHTATRRELGAVSVEATKLSPSPQHDDVNDREPRGVEQARAERGEVTRPMSIVLATSGEGAIAERVLTMLDDQRIVYDVVYISEYAEPRLMVGSSELVGEKEIVAHLAELKQLAGV